ncbi:MAG: LamG domain-containing protein, partial [Planctomycetaceae bacterium]|nr:LamG domain-containing protein [Planctomycetaceae bacterium]
MEWLDIFREDAMTGKFKICLLLVFAVSGGAVAASQPVARYLLDGNALDEGPGALHGSMTDVTPTIDRFGNSDAAIHLNGSSSIVAFPAESTNGLTSGTISFWVKVDTDSVQYNLLAKIPDQGDPLFRSQLGTDPPGYAPPLDRFYFKVNGENIDYVPADSSFDFTVWNCFTLVWSQTQKRMYLNGELLSTVNGSFTSPGVGDLVLGYNSQSSGGVQERLRGSVDDLVIYDRAMSDIEVSLSCKLVSCYPLDGNADDFAGHFDASAEGTGIGEDPYGNVDGALCFEATGARIVVPAESTNSLPSGAILLFARTATDQIQYNLFGKDYMWTNSRFRAQFGTIGSGYAPPLDELYFKVNDTAIEYSNPLDMVVMDWHMYSFVWDEVGRR